MRGNIFDPLGIIEGIQEDMDRLSDLAESLVPPGNPGHNPGNPCGQVGFRAIRRTVMKRTWDKVGELERAGQVVTSQMFGNILQEEWERARQACGRSI